MFSNPISKLEDGLCEWTESKKKKAVLMPPRSSLSDSTSAPFLAAISPFVCAPALRAAAVSQKVVGVDCHR
jgi:hypothetical protein